MERYKRQIQLPQIGETGQQKLKYAKILVVGAGGLGCTILPYLTAAGIESIGIIDGDTIEKSNLQRQILYTEKTVSLPKVAVAKAQLEALNSNVNFKVYNYYLSGENALEIFKNYDIIVDATDSIKTRYLINDACILTNKPFVYGSIYRFEGQVSVFNYKNGPTYRCLFKNDKAKTTNCEDAGVLGTTVGFVGMLQANEVMKMLLETGNILSGKMLVYNTLTNAQNCFNFNKIETNSIDEAFFNSEYNTHKIEAACLSAAISEKSIFIDVRELHETPKIELPNSLQIPLSVLENELENLDKNQSYAVFCQSGKRSLEAIKILKEHHFQNVKNIEGGVISIQKKQVK
ncbi:HesA/MoeB/ThiF family protein [Winogradskyella bathintestinalis]|uniref:HesA/MoeB/ThiF family protein n=1 Tax=Winogradskyella bathintestinalis TaxID=3035208 RepID=A0ABT7ZSB0_9FLAO|nr:HesA/MoeB/ThiF family protein [Winogradskyella bathintestinalis]MDN3491895.1 HesA/MoeB/ThiF family protein [Winogradskyella bathintestinalis]